MFPLKVACSEREAHTQSLPGIVCPEGELSQMGKH